MVEKIVVIEKGAPLPNVGSTFTFKSIVSDRIETMRVAQIRKLKWNKDGDLIVTVVGKIVGRTNVVN